MPVSMNTVEECFESTAGRACVLRRITPDLRDGELVTVFGASGAGDPQRLEGVAVPRRPLSRAPLRVG